MKKIIAVILTIVMTISVGSQVCFAQSEGIVPELFQEGFEAKIGEWTYTALSDSGMKFMPGILEDNSFSAIAMLNENVITFGAVLENQWGGNAGFALEGLQEYLETQPVFMIDGCPARLATNTMPRGEMIVYVDAWINGHYVIAYQMQFDTEEIAPYAMAFDLISQLAEQANQKSLQAFDFEALAEEYHPTNPGSEAANLITFENGAFGFAGCYMDGKVPQYNPSVPEVLQRVANAANTTIKNNGQGYYAQLIDGKIAQAKPVYALSAQAGVIELPLTNYAGMITVSFGVQLLPSEFTVEGNQALFMQLANEIETLYGAADDYWLEANGESYALEEGVSPAELSATWKQISDLTSDSIYLKMVYGNLTISLEKAVYAEDMTAFGCWMTISPYI